MTKVFQQHGDFYKLRISTTILEYDCATGTLEAFDLPWYLLMSLKNEAVLVPCPVGTASMITEAQSCITVFLQTCLQFNRRWLAETKPTPATLSVQHYKRIKQNIPSDALRLNLEPNLKSDV